MQVQPRIGGVGQRVVLGLGALRVVAQHRHAPRHAVPHLLQLGAWRGVDALRVAPDLDDVAVVDRADGVAVRRQAMLPQGLQHSVALRCRHLQQHAGLFVEQREQGLNVTARADLLGPVFGIAPVVGFVAFEREHVHIQADAAMPGEGHFAGSRPQAAVGSVVIGPDQAGDAQFSQRRGKRFQQVRAVEIGGDVADLPERLRQDACAHTLFALAQIDQNQAARRIGAQLRRKRAAHVGQRGEGGDHQRDRRSHTLGLARVFPARMHGQRILAHRHRNTQGGTEFHADGVHGVVQRGVLPRLAAGGHPVARQLDVGQTLHRGGQQIEYRLAHRQPTRRGGVEHRNGRALGHAHRLAPKTGVVSERDGAVDHRHLPGADHGIAVAHAAYRAVANGDEKALARHRGVAQHRFAGLRQIDPSQIERLALRQLPLRLTMHARRLAQQHVQRQIDRTGQIGLVGVQAVIHDQSLLLRGDAHHRKGAALAGAQRGESLLLLWSNGQNIALLAFVTPYFSWT